jgi:hypothetical protein
MTFGDLDGSRLSPRWVGRVARAMRIARLKNHVVLVFTIFGAAGALLSLAAVVGYERQHDTLARLSSWVREQGGPGWLADGLAGLGRWVDELWSGPGFLTGVGSVPGEPVTAADVVIGGGQLFLLGLASGAVLLARGAIRAEGARRGLNVVWDVIAFWPRSVHPFVPPPYAQEVVPALVRRICWLLGERTDPFVAVRGDGAPRRLSQNPEPARHLVLAAHSQGSLISLAALMWLPPTVVPKVSWLTFGSQLRQQFPRAFPHYVRVSDLQDLQKRHRWLSLYRDTDPIAGPVTSWCHRSDDGRPRSHRLNSPDECLDDVVDPVTGRRQCGAEWRLLDPAPDDTECQRRAVARIAGHSDYWMSPDWDHAVSWVRAPIPPAEWVTVYPPVPGPTPEPRPDPPREPAPGPVPESGAESGAESVDLRWTSRVWRKAPGRRSASSRW